MSALGPRRIAFLHSFWLIASCQYVSPESSAITNQFVASGRVGVDLELSVPGAWTRVCILGPYADNDAAAQTLGFEWPAEKLTDISQNEGISLLVFAWEKVVLSYIEHPRSSGDFSNLTGRCFPKSGAKFIHVVRPVTGWPGLFPATEI